MATRNDSTALLQLSDVSFRYSRRPVLHQLDLVVRRGIVFGLIGPNGCGKTTTLHVATGLLRPADGWVEILGHRLPGRAEQVNAQLAYVPDQCKGFDHLRVEEYLRFVAALHRANAGYLARAQRLATLMGLTAYSETSLGELSYGTRRKVALVAAAVLGRPLLILDEATSGLDPESVFALERLVRGIASQGSSVLLATQDVFFAERVCDEVGLLTDGRIAACGVPAELTRSTGHATLRDVLLSVAGLDAALEGIDATVADAHGR